MSTKATAGGDGVGLCCHFYVTTLPSTDNAFAGL